MMESSDTFIEAPFTYLWVIENYSELTYIDLKSPLFIPKSISKFEWYLKIDEYVGFCCWLQSEDAPRKEISAIDIEVSILAEDGSQTISKRNENPSLRINLLTRAAFLERWAEFLPNNTLTIQCRMWRKDQKISTTDLCYARTRLKTYTESFLWPIKQFSELRSCAAEDFINVTPDERKVYPLKPFTEKGPFMALILYLKQNSQSEDVCVDLLIEKGKNYAFSCELSVLDANGAVIQSHEERGRTNFSWTFLRFWPLISKNKLISSKDLFLPNDTLFLKCSFEVCTGIISNEIEYMTPNVSKIVKVEEEVLDFFVAEMDADESLIYEEYFIKDENENDLADN
ncbi:unnamed protein product [Larinioides sclopetarius]|uniref:MATH domain-containing protein n=1 Tax=Larinioides sclopetarius TaxID=280406 RepID=A0AAV2BNS3_9ARAC